jgi:hypothetical protein
VLDSSDLFDRNLHADLEASQRHVLDLERLHARLEKELATKGSPYRSAR